MLRKDHSDPYKDINGDLKRTLLYKSFVTLYQFKRILIMCVIVEFRPNKKVLFSVVDKCGILQEYAPRVSYHVNGDEMRFSKSVIEFRIFNCRHSPFVTF